MKNKGTSEKKGISLIVLVITIIVIIILAVAVILSIANNNPIENAKEAKFKNDMKTIEEELSMYIAKNYADSQGTNMGVSNLEGETMVSALPSTKNYQDKVKIKNGKLYVISGELTKDEQKWVKEVGVAEEKTYKIGDEVTYEGEPFYIIGGDTVGTAISASTQDILLLAKYNLTSDGSSQDQNGNSNPCAFSSTAYWNSVSGIAYPDADGKYPDLNDETKYGSGSPVIAKAKAYGASLKATGRLMTYEEAEALKTDYSEILYGNKDGNKLNYWLGSANFERNVLYVSGEDSVLNTNLFDNGYGCGARPVINVPKSSIN